MLRTGLAILALALTAVPCVAAPAELLQPTEQSLAESQRLVDSLYPAKVEAMAIDNLLSSLARQMKKTPNLAEAEAVYPGIVDAAVNAMSPIMMEEAQKGRETQRVKMRTFFAQRINATNLAAIADFWAGPVGRSLRQSIISNATYDNVSADVMKNVDQGDVDISSAAIKSDAMRAGYSAVLKMSREDRSAYYKFILSPAGKAFTAVLPEKSKIDIEMFNKKPSPETDKRVEDAVITAMTTYAEKAEAKNSAAENAKKGD